MADTACARNDTKGDFSDTNMERRPDAMNLKITKSIPVEAALTKVFAAHTDDERVVE